MHSIRTPWLSPALTKLDTRPRPGPERDLCSRIAELADCSGDVVDAEADVMKTFTVLVEPDGERRVARSGCTSWM